MIVCEGTREQELVRVKTSSLTCIVRFLNMGCACCIGGYCGRRRCNDILLIDVREEILYREILHWNSNESRVINIEECELKRVVVVVVCRKNKLHIVLSSLVSLV